MARSLILRLQDPRSGGSEEVCATQALSSLSLSWRGAYYFSLIYFYPLFLSLHGIKKFGVGLGALKPVAQEFHGGQLIHIVYHLTQNPHLL